MKKKMEDRLAIVVPCYNEEEVLSDTEEKLSNLVDSLVKKGKISSNSFILFVNDGSKDKTWELISQFNKKNKYVYGLGLAGNVGHQNALLAGLMKAKEICDMSISIDADLQDDITVIEEMIDKYYDGCDIVYGVRNSRGKDSFFKKHTALGFYKFMNFMGVKSVFNHADYRLMSKRSMDQLGNYKERNLFLRGIVPLIGYKTDCVYYKRLERLAGKSKYPLKKMISFAIDGVTSFSIKPMSMIAGLGIIIILFSIGFMIYSIIQYFLGNVVSGWSSLFCSIWFLGGIQLLSIGTIGQYVGKTYIEVKERPRYNVDTFLTQDTKEVKNNEDNLS